MFFYCEILTRDAFAAEHSSQLTIFRYNVAFSTLEIITQGYEFVDDNNERTT
jgi:hypothetical protein